MALFVLCVYLMVMSSSAYNDLCIRNSGLDDMDQRYIFDLNSQQPYGAYNLVWKGVKKREYWFFLAKFNGSYEWTIDDHKYAVHRYCTLPAKQQKKITEYEELKKEVDKLD